MTLDTIVCRRSCASTDTASHQVGLDGQKFVIRLCHMVDDYLVQDASVLFHFGLLDKVFLNLDYNKHGNCNRTDWGVKHAVCCANDDAQLI